MNNVILAAVLFACVISSDASGQIASEGAGPTDDPLAGMEEISSLRWVSIDESASEQWSSHVAWARAEQLEQTLRETAEVRALVSMRGDLELTCYLSLSCSIILGVEGLRPEFSSQDTFESARAEAWGFAYPFIRAAQITERDLPETEDVEMELRLRSLREQIMRSALGDLYTDGATQLSELERRLAGIMLRYEISIRDRDNALALAQLIENRGWPLRTRYSAQANHAGWLIAQHADRDPSFQLQVLELFERAPRSVIPGRNYAALYDRVHLKTEGIQRYATQWVCVDGRWTPRPLERPSEVESLRRRLGMDPLPDMSSPC